MAAEVLYLSYFKALMTASLLSYVKECQRLFWSLCYHEDVP